MNRYHSSDMCKKIMHCGSTAGTKSTVQYFLYMSEVSYRFINISIKVKSKSVNLGIVPGFVRDDWPR